MGFPQPYPERSRRVPSLCPRDLQIAWAIAPSLKTRRAQRNPSQTSRLCHNAVSLGLDPDEVGSVTRRFSVKRCWEVTSKNHRFTSAAADLAANADAGRDGHGQTLSLCRSVRRGGLVVLTICVRFPREERPDLQKTSGLRRIDRVPASPTALQVRIRLIKGRDCV